MLFCIKSIRIFIGYFVLWTTVPCVVQFVICAPSESTWQGVVSPVPYFNILLLFNYFTFKSCKFLDYVPIKGVRCLQEIYWYIDIDILIYTGTVCAFYENTIVTLNVNYDYLKIKVRVKVTKEPLFHFHFIFWS